MSNTRNGEVKVYFENLNAIRFIAAFLVIITHSEQLKDRYHIANWNNKAFISLFGDLGVTLFFVLSGFLISYLLFKEREITQTISIRNFYIRRILRIWPLYFLIILSSLFIFPFVKFLALPGVDSTTIWNGLFYKLLLFIFFLPNLEACLLGTIPFAAQTWSIGAEEQFYLVWPALNKYIKNKWLMMFSVILVYVAIKYSCYIIPHSSGMIFYKYWLTTPIDSMAIGGIFALIVYETTPTSNFIRKILFSTITQLIILLVVIVAIWRGYFFYSLCMNEFYAVLFGILICNFAANNKRLFSMENPVSNYLGKISYGLYMYHLVSIVIAIQLCQFLTIENWLLQYFFIFIVTIGISSLSYQFFERKFIRLKLKYSDIVSGDNAKNT